MDTARTILLLVHLSQVSSQRSGEKLSQLCNRVPSEDEIQSMAEAKFWVPECDAGDLIGCPDPGQLSVLTHNIRCFKRACDSEQIPKEMEQCMMELRHQFQNLFQFRPFDFEQQVQKACQCKYPSQGKVGSKTLDACHGQSSCGSVRGQRYSLDAMTLLEEFDVCSVSFKESKEQLHAFREVLELNRIRSICNESHLAILKQGKLLDAIPEFAGSTGTSLLEACSNECYYPLEHFDMFEQNPYLHVPEKDWDEKCGKFTWLQGRTFYSGTIHFKQIHATWKIVHESCFQFKLNKGEELHRILKFAPFPRSLISEKDMISALAMCCKDSDYYEKFKVDEDRNHMRGVLETICLTPKNVLMGFGFTGWFVRNAIERNSGQCWLYNSSVKHNLNEVDAQKCDQKSPIEQMDLNTSINPAEIFWFLKFVSNSTVKRIMLASCAKGEQMGKRFPVLPGLQLGIEAQKYAIGSKNMPVELRSEAMLAFETCAVFSSVHSNGYFELNSCCNNLINEQDSCEVPQKDSKLKYDEL